LAVGSLWYSVGQAWPTRDTARFHAALTKISYLSVMRPSHVCRVRVIQNFFESSHKNC